MLMKRKLSEELQEIQESEKLIFLLREQIIEKSQIQEATNIYEEKINYDGLVA